MIFALTSCKNPISPEETNQKGSIQFSFGESSQLKTLAKTNETASAVLVTLTDSKVGSIFQLKKIDLVSFGDVYITQPIELSVGDYLVTEFVVIDQSNKALYASPKVGSPLASVVSKPLPVELNVQKDQVSNLKLEVVKVDDSVPEDFGYVSFKFDIIETIDFLVAVSVYNSETQGFELTESALEVIYGSKSLYSETIPSLINHVIIKNEGDSTVYELKISKTGYKTQTKQFTNDELKLYKAKPIIFVLEEGQETQNELLLMHTSNNESYSMYSDGTGIKKLLNYGYPIWMNEGNSIAVQSADKIYIYNYKSLNLEKTIQLNPSIGGFYLGYSDITKRFTSIGNNNGYQSIIITDESGNAIHIKRNFNIGSPATSAVDDWIYFVSADAGVNNIHRMKSDGSQEETLTFETEYTYGSFGVSYDGTLIVAPKIKGSKKYLAVFNIGTKNETLIDVSTLGQDTFGYATISKNMEYIYFTATTSRNLYKIKLDGTGLQQLTFSNITFHRAKAW